MAKITVQNDRTRAQEEVQGSDGRLNTSSRSDNRAYYNSRDEEQCYSMSFSHDAAADGEYSFYLKNISTTKTLVITNIEVNAANIARLKLWEVTGTAADGVARIPKNQNLASSNAADVTALHDGAGTTISGLSTSGAELDDLSVVANGHSQFHLNDRLRLGQNDAIAVEMDTGTSTPLVYGTVFFYFE